MDRRVNNNKRYSNQLRMRDPFEDMFALRDRMLSNFGFGMMDPFGDDDFMGRRNRHDFDDFGFHGMDIFDKMPQGGGNFVCHSVSQTTTIGPDGKPVTKQQIRNKTQTYDSKGNRIVEDNEFYKDSRKGVKRYIKQKTLGDKTVKVKREKFGDQLNEERELQNLDEDELHEFNRKWNKKAQKTNMPRLANHIKSNNNNQARSIQYRF